MASLSKELVLLILQFLEEEKFTDSARRLEQESGFYFNLFRFEELVMNGDWENVEKYLSGFTTMDDNRYSMKMFFEIQKQKYLEALDRKDKAKAIDILMMDLKSFAATNPDLFRELTLLLTLENFRENEQLSKYMDSKTGRTHMLIELKKLIESNPLLREKLNFPAFANARLRTLINQSLNWQHQLCKTPQPNPDIKTLFSDHSCGSSQQNGGRAPSPVTNHLMGSVARPLGFPSLTTAHGPYQPAPGGLQASMAGWMLNASQVPHPSAHAGPIGFNPQQHSISPLLKRPQTPTNNMVMDYHTADSEHVRKRSRPSFGLPDEVNNAQTNALPVAFTSQTHGHSSNHQYSADDLPKTVIMNLNQGSEVKSMDFHPIQRTLLLVGTISGEVMIWELGSRNRICHQRFGVWNLGACSAALQGSLTSNHSVSVNRVMWNPDGSLFGVAYSKHIVHIYKHNGEELGNFLEIEAHVGSVNDLAFSYPNKKACIITCGEDKLIKVWDAVSGAKQYTFESHKAPVHSVCPHHREAIQFIFSTAIDGKIKAWLYDDEGPRLDYDAPGHAMTTMAYSADGKRLFSCGTSSDGDAYLVEWNESEGAVKRTYTGLGNVKKAGGIIQFDTTKNRILAAGNDYMIKFWDMDNSTMLGASDADGGLPASPCIRFNKEGMLLAVSTNENAVKILGSGDGVQMLRTIENIPYDGSRIVSSGTVVKSPSVAAAMGSNTFDRVSPLAPLVAVNGEHQSLADTKPRIQDEPAEKSIIINEPSHCLSLRLPDCSKASKVSRLTYTNSGFGLLALTTNAVHKLWKWKKGELNPTGKATANTSPTLWQPTKGAAMTNDISTANLEDAVPCFALSKNDSYVMSASGGKISLFNMMTFKTMLSFRPPPPAATCLAFHPRDNNVVAIGMDECSIQIYNVRSDEECIKLKGHQKRITGLAFSNILSLLVSSGSDSQLCVWSMDTWEKILSKYIQLPAGRSVAPAADTHVQFHQNQKHLLVVHETQIAIYEAPSLNCLKQWKPLEASGPITYATYSCDSETIYVSHEDGIVAVLTASTLRLRCRIYSSSYISANPSARTYPIVIAAHPTEPNQIALGLSDGGVCVLEPLESDGKWGTLPIMENGAVKLQDHHAV